MFDILLYSFIPYKEIDRISNFAIGAPGEDYSRCFNKNDEPNVTNDIFEIRHAGGNDGTSIHVSIIDEETREDLLFGQNADIDYIIIDGALDSSGRGLDGLFCNDNSEASFSLKIQNGAIIESECVQRLYCLEIRSAGNAGNDLLVLRNDEEIATLAGATISQTFEDFTRCFNKNDEPDVANDIFEIRHANGNDGASIHVSIVDEGTRTDLLFGPNADLDSITMDSSSVWAAVAHIPGRDGNYCLEESEAASSIKFQNGVIIESECVEAS